MARRIACGTLTLLFSTGATLVPEVLMASCNSAGSPQECLNRTSAEQEPACTWLMLKGRCTDSAGATADATPPSCCASKAVGSACEHETSELYDGMCRIFPTSHLRSINLSPSLEEIKRMFHLSAAAYCPASQVENWSCGEHCAEAKEVPDQQYVYNADKAIGCFVAWDSLTQSILLSFRGTDNINIATSVRNWALNLDASKQSPFAQYPKASVHTGFWEGWQSLKVAVLDAMKTVKPFHPGVSRVRLTGHSLGAALASNAALDLKLNHGMETSVVNFGSPRPGNYDYHLALLAEVPHTRVTHRNDMVVHVPPQWMGFYHAATEVYFHGRNSSNFQICDGSGEDSSCANSCAQSWSCTSIDDHEHYLGMDLTCATQAVIV